MNEALRRGILETAAAIGANPLDLATAISYETAGTFDPMKRGPTTQWGQHRGLIQFGEPQARQHGVDWNDPLGSQLGANGAIARYFRQSGFKPGMSGLDLYSTINAGSPGRYSASDANNGGAPGNVRDKWENQMGGHQQKAASLLGDMYSAPPVAGTPAAAQTGGLGAMFGPDAGLAPGGPMLGNIASQYLAQRQSQIAARQAERVAEDERRRALLDVSLGSLYG